ncbi:MAG: preprotein translocase subunit SecG [Alphaproteobacteria bacterium]
MENLFLVVHLLIASALVGSILLQRSEGGALGIGGGGGGGMLSSRGAANALTRTTSLLAVGFFCTSILLTLLAQGNAEGPASVLEVTPDTAASSAAPEAPLSDLEGDGLAPPVDAGAVAGTNAPPVPMDDMVPMPSVEAPANIPASEDQTPAGDAPATVKEDAAAPEPATPDATESEAEPPR